MRGLTKFSTSYNQLQKCWNSCSRGTTIFSCNYRPFSLFIAGVLVEFFNVGQGEERGWSDSTSPVSPPPFSCLPLPLTLSSWIVTSLGYVHNFLQTRVVCLILHLVTVNLYLTVTLNLVAIAISLRGKVVKTCVNSCVLHVSSIDSW